MQSVQESKQELEAAIRYAENAISSANKTIESMEFRQEMAKKQYAEQTGREEALTKQVQGLNDAVQFHIDREAGFLDQIKELKEANMSLVCDNDDLKDELFKLREDKERLTALEIQLRNKISDLKSDVNALEQPERPTMPVIPKDVAIAIFREGVQSGVNDAVAELEGQTINICENEYCGDFEVTFAKDIHLDDELDLDWMRGKVGQYNEEFVVDALKGLCADKEFECRIHGIDEQES